MVPTARRTLPNNLARGITPMLDMKRRPERIIQNLDGFDKAEHKYSYLSSAATLKFSETGANLCIYPSAGGLMPFWGCFVLCC